MIDLIELRTTSETTSPQDIATLQRWFSTYIETGEFNRLQFPLTEIERDPDDDILPGKATYFKALVGKHAYFLKIYQKKQSQVVAELTNNVVLADCEEANVPRLHQVIQSGGTSLLIYDFVEGVTLQKYLSAQIFQGKSVDQDLMRELIDQTIALEKLANHPGILKTNYAQGPALPPLAHGLVSSKLHDRFVQAYQPFGVLKLDIEQMCPGMILDRHPRNAMVAGGHVYNIDFEIIERVSPVFDLLKLLRGGVTQNELLPHFADLDNEAESAKRFLQLNAFTRDEERNLVEYARQRLGNTTDPNDFYYFYLTGVAHTHLRLMNRSATVFKQQPDLMIAHNLMHYHALGYLSLQTEILDGASLVEHAVSKDQIRELNGLVKEVILEGGFNI